MSEKFNETAYFDKWDNTVKMIMIALALGLTGFAIVLNLMVADAHKDCSSATYVYCGETKVDNHH